MNTTWQPTQLDLAAPELGESVLRHDATFKAWDAGLGGLRDTVNLGIDALNQVGAGLRKLPEGDLTDYLVAPLTGDYREIRQNAEACGQVRDALSTYADDCRALSVQVQLVWSGAAGVACLFRLQAHGLVAEELGLLVGRGAVVFEEIAEFSERLAVEVEELVVELGEALGRAARKLLSRVAGPAGWAAFGLDLALNGLDAVTDIIDDIRLVLDHIDQLLALQDTVRAWVEEQRTRLEILRELPAIASRS